MFTLLPALANGANCVNCGHGIGFHALSSIMQIPYVIPPFASTDMVPNFQAHGFINAPLFQSLPFFGIIDAGILSSLPPTEINISHYDVDITPRISSFLRTNPVGVSDGKLASIARNALLLDAIFHFGYGMAVKRGVRAVSTSGHTSPDFSYYKDGIPIVIGEEQAVNLAEGLQTLNRKFSWIASFNNVPFVSNFVVTRDELAIYRKERNNNPHHLIFYSSMNTVIQRWNCVKAAINVARMIQYFSSQHLYTPSALEFDTPHLRIIDPNNFALEKYITIQVGVIVKYIDTSVAATKRGWFYKRMKDLYHLLVQQGIQHVEYLKRVSYLEFSQLQRVS
jgi:hypothetical protein